MRLHGVQAPAPRSAVDIGAVVVLSLYRLKRPGPCRIPAVEPQLLLLVAFVSRSICRQL